ncbi:MAG: hypothetical protein F6K54_24590 [Okeania sp. SIO3B5]|uniref:hypothetical protein n=1 Tax=Okeania sp. SIO3B5 TaxID=2607811 RepID=UPI0013FE883B|nr:hypothetical protein [Okeania sp. SIO3B5]NEO55965.1 hypothetical protein [Okeania sp. SIO3B5]
MFLNNTVHPVNIKSGSIGVIRWGDGEMEKYLVMVEDGTFFYTELNGFDIKSQINREKSKMRTFHFPYLGLAD